MVSLAQAEGVDAAGTTSDREALSQLESGAVGGLVVGGVQQVPRHLRTVAAGQGIALIRGALGGKDRQVYARQELAPQLKEILR